MTASHPSAEAHLDAGQLVRFIDDETMPGERHDIVAHLDGCASCRETAERLARRSERISRIVAMADPPLSTAAPGRSAPVWWRAAAVLALAIGVALSSSTLRAWISGGLHAVTSAVGLADGDDAVVVPPTEILRATFEPRAGDFAIVFRHRPTAGTLVIETVDADALARLSTTRTEPLLVLPDAVSIENAAAGNTDYRLELPSIVGRVTVVIGGDSLAFRDSARPGSTWRLDLAAARP